MGETTTVHAFTVWDQNVGDNLVGPRLGTLEAIKRIRGKEIDGTARDVDQSEVDPDGFYPRRIPVTEEERNLLRAFQHAIDTNGKHPLTKDQIDRFIESGLLQSQGIAVRLTDAAKLIIR